MMFDRQTLLLGAGWLGVLAAGVGLALVPASRSVQRVRAEIAELRAEAAKPTDGPEVMQALQAELEALTALGANRTTPIPNDSDVAGLMRDFSAMLDELGLTRREMTTGVPRQLDEASSMPMSMNLEGSFPQIYEAARYIESLPRLVRVQRFRVQSPSLGSGSIDRSAPVKAELLIDVFYQPRVIESGSVRASAGVTP